MKRILLLLENRQNRHLLADWLRSHYAVVLADTETDLSLPFDLCILDGTALNRYWQRIQQRKAEENTIFLPFVLITAQRETELLTRHLWQTIDELVRVPIEKLELQARVEILLRTRRLSLEVQRRSADQESFFHAMTHDVRAPLRAIKSFSQLLAEDSDTTFSLQARQDLQRVQEATQHMQEIIDSLVNFARIGWEEIQLQNVDLKIIMERCVRQISSEIQEQQAQIILPTNYPTVYGNPFLLKTIINNLLSNALKFMPPGTTPIIQIRTSASSEYGRLEIQDNGIGIAAEDQKRLFTPFTQLHSAEIYSGVGLGLATVHKAVELMSGRIGITSQPGQGSTFWIELNRANKEGVI